MAAEPKRTAGDDRVLPPEIWREILTRLPAKSILRCRSVRKSWYSLISSPDFVSHYSVNKKGKRLLLQPYDNNGGIVTAYFVDRGILSPFSSHDESFTESHEHGEVPEAFQNAQNTIIVGTCNGLICLSEDKSYGDVKVTRFLIWNPTIRKVVEVPSVSKVVKDQSFFTKTVRAPKFGFGFDSKTGDYKILCTQNPADSGENVCEIYDLRKCVWRGISPLMQPWNVWGAAPQCYLNGAVHWTGSSRRVWGSDIILLSFDMSDEIFREIRMPEEFVLKEGDYEQTETRSLAFRGLIHVIAWKRDHDVLDVNEDCSVWAMKEYGIAESWTKLFSIDLKSAEFFKYTEPYRFRLWENGEVFMERDLSKNEYGYDDGEYDWEKNMESREIQELLLYNPESRKCKQLFSFTKPVTIKCLYEESLVLM